MFNCSSTCTVVFQMIEGANDQQKEALGIMTPDYYCYLNQSGTYKVDGTNDSKDFRETMVHIQYTGENLDPSQGGCKINGMGLVIIRKMKATFRFGKGDIQKNIIFEES